MRESALLFGVGVQVRTAEVSTKSMEFGFHALVAGLDRPRGCEAVPPIDAARAGRNLPRDSHHRIRDAEQAHAFSGDPGLIGSD